jgi:hypothetical protein
VVTITATLSRTALNVWWAECHTWTTLSIRLQVAHDTRVYDALKVVTKERRTRQVPQHALLSLGEKILPHLKRAELGGFLDLMCLHPQQDIMQRFNST